MENAQSILNKVSMFFAELVGDQMPPVSGEPKATESKMMEAKLKDGTIVEVTELMVGGIVTIEGVAAPIGEHMLEDGTMIVLGDNGVIMEIKPAMDEEVAPAIPEEPIGQEDMSAKFAAFESATNEKFAAYEDKFETDFEPESGIGDASDDYFNDEEESDENMENDVEIDLDEMKREINNNIHTTLAKYFK